MVKNKRRIAGSFGLLAVLALFTALLPGGAAQAGEGGGARFIAQSRAAGLSADKAVMLPGVRPATAAPAQGTAQTRSADRSTRDRSTGIRMPLPQRGDGSSILSGAEIVNYASFKCLDHSNAGQGLYAYVYYCNNFNNQSWSLIYYGAPWFAYEIVNFSGKCLDHSDVGRGLYAFVHSCNGFDNQLWYM